MHVDRLRKFSILYLHASDDKTILGKMKYWTNIFYDFAFLNFSIFDNDPYIYQRRYDQLYDKK